jgi:diphthamide biosynthesis protein 7
MKWSVSLSLSLSLSLKLTRYYRSPRPWNGYENVLAIADAKGQIQLHSLDQKTVKKALSPFSLSLHRINGVTLVFFLSQMQLSLIEIIKVADEKTLCLSLDWSTRLKTAPE